MCSDKPARWLSDEVVDRCDPTDVILEADEERALVRNRMSRLDAREHAVLTLRYGLEGECLTLTEIGRRLGLCRVWVHQIELARFANSPAPAVVPSESGCRIAQPASTMATPSAQIVARCDPTE